MTRVLRGLVAALVCAGACLVAVAGPAPTPAAAADLQTAVQQAGSYAAGRGSQVGISVVDRETGAVYENAAAHTQMRSASVLKVFVAESLIARSSRGEIRLTQADRDLMWSMVARSDDAAMSNLYSRFGGLSMIVSVIGKYNLTEIGGPPTPSYWGMYQITAHDISAFYRGVLEGGLAPADRDLLVSLMRAAQPTGSDGFDQFFGIPRALPYQYWGVKQGWMCCQEGQRRLHTTGILGQDNRFVVSVLSQSSQSVSYAQVGQTLTEVVRLLFPGGTIPPGGATRVPFGSVDTVVQVAPGRFTATGWAADPDVPTTPLAVHVYVDGRLAGYGTASGDRPDVAVALPGYGAAHGYSVGFGVAEGVHTACAFAINVGPGNQNPSLGCRTVEVRSSPTGNFEAGTAVGLRGMRVQGWTLDPDAPGTPTGVRVDVDGRPVTTVAADRSRPDIGAYFPGAGDGHGFDLTLGMAWPGSHQVCVTALNVGGTPGADRLLTCRTVVGPTTMLGRADSVVGGSGELGVGGWAVDALLVDRPVEVHVYVDGGYVGRTTADQPRPDVAAVFPEAGAARGFSLTAPATAGAHTVCAYAIYADRRADNPQLTCARVVVG